MADITFILDDGDGTITVEREPSWNTPQNKPRQLAKMLTKDAPAPPAGVSDLYWAWDGAKIVEVSPAVKAAIDAAIADAAQEAEDNAAPDTGYANLSREMKWTIKMFLKLGQHLGINETAMKNIMRQEWDATAKGGTA